MWYRMEAAIQSDVEPWLLPSEASLSADARAILESMGDAFYALDADWRIVYANQRALAFWGLRAEAVAGRVIWQALPALLGTPNEMALRDAVALQQTISFEAPSPVTGIWVRVNVVPYGDGVTVYWRDISARRLSEQILHDSEEHLRLAQEAAGIGTWEYDLRSHNIRWSPQMFPLLGCDPHEASARGIYALWQRALHPCDRPWVEPAVRRSAVRCEPFRLEFRVTRPDGSVRWISCRGNVLPDDDGQPARMLGVCIDVTEAKQTEEALERRVAERTQALRETVEELEQSRSRYSAVFNHSPVDLALLRVDPDHTVICEEANPAWTRHSGCPAEAVIGRPYAEAFTPEQTAFWHAQYRKVIETGEKVEYEYTTTLPGGEVTCRSFLVPLRDADGTITHVLLTSVDLTERRRIEAQFRQAQKMEAIGQLTGGVAHDFNNLLTAVIGNLELLSRRPLEPDARHFVDSALRAAKRGGTLTQQLLATARSQTLSPEPVDANAVIDRMGDLLQHTLGGLVQVETGLDPDLAPAWADAAQLELMILNLAINARDAMPSGGRIRVETRNQGAADPDLPVELEQADYVVISVIDEGTGMPPEVAERAFEPFFTTKPPGKGSGLGLAQVYGLARQFGGSVRLHSVPDRGTTVDVFLPRATEAPSAEAPPPPAIARPRTVAEGTLLVAEDDADVRELTVGFLAEAGYQVQAARDGREALAMLRQAPVSLLLADYAMPDMAGTDLVRRARAIQPDLAVIYLTGNADPVEARAHQDGDGLLTKPYLSIDLLAAVEQAMGRGALSAPPSPSTT
jgi:PAS domain S-box-containing protein